MAGKHGHSEDDELSSYQPPKLPKTSAEKGTDASHGLHSTSHIETENNKRLIVILEHASLETVKVGWFLRLQLLLLVGKVGKGFQLLNSTDHANILKKHERDPINLRPDIVHQVMICSSKLVFDSNSVSVNASRLAAQPGWTSAGYISWMALHSF